MFVLPELPTGGNLVYLFQHVIVDCCIGICRRLGPRTEAKNGGHPLSGREWHRADHLLLLLIIVDEAQLNVFAET